MSTTKRILLIEDDGSLKRDLIKDLTAKGYEVKHANSYIAALDRWKDNKGVFDCIILDLNIKPDEMDEEKYSKYFPIHGILILDKICEGIVPEEKIKIWIKTIVYSAYLDKLREYRYDFMYYNLLTLIPKEGTNSFKILEDVEKIVN